MAKRKQKSPLDYISLPNFNMNPDVKRSIFVVLIFVFAAILFLSLIDLAGAVGPYLSSGLSYMAGWAKWIIPFLLLAMGFLMVGKEKRSLGALHYIGVLIFLWAVSALLQFLVEPADWDLAIEQGKGGGYIGWSLAIMVMNLVGFWAGFVVLFALLFIGLMLMFNSTLSAIFAKGTAPVRLAFHPFAWLLNRMKENNLAKQYDKEFLPDEIQRSEEFPIEDSGPSEDNFSARPLKGDKAQISKKVAAVVEEKSQWKPTNVKIDLPFDLLNGRTTKPTSGDIKANGEIIKNTLEKFGIPVEMGEVSVGPTVTQYTLKPIEGIKLSRITTLNNDLSMALAAHPLRIEAPIPGKSLVGIEVPNKTVAAVPLKEVLDSDSFRKRKSNLMIGLGKDVAGQVWLDNLAKMPHLLVAGQTGSGKSVMLNTMIVSLLYQNNPDDLKFILVDPKRVELTIYNGLPHLLTPVITEVSKTINALKWCLNEMDRRFDTLSKVHKRDIESYNEGAKEKMPYIVFIIDELADLMVVAAKDMETGVVRLAQMARAVGIHLVLATQRPSVNVITGTIKANMPARIAFAVASGIDSRTILDSSGAEKLLGRGDMLFSNASLSKPKRLQGALITDQEIKRIVSYIKDKSGEPNYLEEITERQKVKGMAGVGIDGGSDDDDELLSEAKELIINSGKASASYLQRRLSIGYARAARLLDLLEESGIIGPSNGAKPREILISQEQYASIIDQGVSGVRLHNQAEAVAPDEYLPADENDEEDIVEEESIFVDMPAEEIDEIPALKKASEEVEKDEDNDEDNIVEEVTLVEEEIIPIETDEAEPKAKSEKKASSKDDDEDDFGKYFSR
ncbi:MAG: DNA translocase FtsK 4TM domain-containing protein [Candidatus Falkowbacteria bacterium]|nr:DNA translocase FtsK 4TM domain-containing protein [Candidatus Falkowbacteria bacterium]